MADLSVLLKEAQDAYHALVTGQQVVECRDQNGETVRYNLANRPALAAYIEDLKRQLGLTTSLGPMRAWLGC